MPDPQAPLKNLHKEHDYLVAIDSDGCAFDSMEIKHKECFIPNTINYWNLQAVSKYARAAAEFVNLYSKWRGINRWPALTMVFDLLEEWPEVRRRGVEIPLAQPVRDWIARETKLSNATLKVEVEKTGDPVLAQGLEWSEEVNATIHKMVRGVPPFPFVRESLEKIFPWADIIVCSATPCSALEREWEEHDIAKYTKVIAGQEMGSKREHIHLASAGKYDRDKILMIGDAPGDMKAARGNDALFFPVNPGAEEKSWERFFNEASDAFRDGNYTSEYEARLIVEFDKLLPEVPPWKG
jgi:phosphoglycolate phosphatase-like HAD superfamily hydrolase